MKKSYHGQKSENTKLQQQITTLKTEKTNLQQHLLDLQRRVAELELQIGHDEGQH
jgi:predicted  nucleic acid-binding Zn-ribbon protein